MAHNHNNFQSYRNYLGLYGKTTRDRSVNRTASDFERLVVDNPSYQEDCLRNGSPQRFMITRSEVLYKAEITAFPGEELYPGDMIECFGEHWICYQTRVCSSIQVTGTIWLCNHLFRWQNNSPDIIERWGVLDSGVYSTTKTAGYEVNTPDVQYKIYLPLDSDTEKLYVDKRIATNIRYDANGKRILEVYKLTRVDPTSQAYGKGAHLMLLNARSDDFVAEHDNIDERICGYIAPQSSAGTPSSGDTGLLSSTINGRTTVRLGGSRLYTTNIPAPMWEYSPHIDGVSFESEDGGMRLTVDGIDALIGEAITIKVFDVDGKYNASEIHVEVVN